MKKKLVVISLALLTIAGCASFDAMRQTQLLLCLTSLAASGVSVADTIGSGSGDSAKDVLETLGKVGSSNLTASTLAACAPVVQGVVVDVQKKVQEK